MEIKIFDTVAIAALPDGRSIGVNNHELITHDQSMPLPTVRALIAAWDRTQGALPELPPGYSVGKRDGETVWCYRGPDGKIVYHWEENAAGFKRWIPDCAANAADATRRAWAHFAATLDPKWAQLLRNAGLPV